MTHEAGFITRSELIAFAASQDISAQKVHRWANWGLLPKPEIKGFGRGASTEARFPAEATKTRLLEIAKELQEKHDLAVLQWRLWWQGEDVATERVRRSLTRTIAGQRKTREAARARQTDDEEWVRFDQKHRRRRTDESGLAILQARMDKPAFVRMRKGLEEITTGTLDQRDADETRAAFRQALPGVSNEALSLEAISALSNPDDWSAAFDRVSNDELSLARQELQAFIARLSEACASNPELSFGGFSTGIMQLMLTAISQELPPELFLIWLTCRQHAGFRILFQFFMQTLQLPVAEWSKVVPPTDAAGLL